MGMRTGVGKGVPVCVHKTRYLGHIKHALGKTGESSTGSGLGKAGKENENAQRQVKPSDLKKKRGGGTVFSQPKSIDQAIEQKQIAIK
jgi:hypothetical protein